jgi:hypothetical protein
VGVMALFRLILLSSTGRYLFVLPKLNKTGSSAD